MKKINTESKTYKRIRNTITVASEFGGCLAVDCVMIPMLEGVFQTKGRFFKRFGYVGVYGLSLKAGATASEEINNLVDNFVNGWNDLCDIVNGDSNQPEPSKGMENYLIFDKDAGDKAFHEAIAKHRVFEFPNEEEAKRVFEGLTGLFDIAQGKNHPDGYAYVTVADVMRLRGMDPELVPYSHNQGWTTLEGIGIDKITDTNYILDVFDKLDWVGVVTFDVANKENAWQK